MFACFVAGFVKIFDYCKVAFSKRFSCALTSPTDVAAKTALRLVSTTHYVTAGVASTPTERWPLLRSLPCLPKIQFLLPSSSAGSSGGYLSWSMSFAANIRYGTKNACKKRIGD